jgi:hypothetical protein
VDAEDGAVDERPQREVVESVVKVLPGRAAAVLLDNFLIEAIHGSNLPGLVVPAEQDYQLRVLDFIAEEQLNSLH